MFKKLIPVSEKQSVLISLIGFQRKKQIHRNQNRRKKNGRFRLVDRSENPVCRFWWAFETPPTAPQNNRRYPLKKKSRVRP
jgi:ssDNA-binding Zn-finger/Zn-ribbon topoisomerase 1